jgi:hypothetical protein
MTRPPEGLPLRSALLQLWVSLFDGGMIRSLPLFLLAIHASNQTNHNGIQNITPLSSAVASIHRNQWTACASWRASKSAAPDRRSIRDDYLHATKPRCGGRLDRIRGKLAGANLGGKLEMSITIEPGEDVRLGVINNPGITRFFLALRRPACLAAQRGVARFRPALRSHRP